RPIQCSKFKTFLIYWSEQQDLLHTFYLLFSRDYFADSVFPGNPDLPNTKALNLISIKEKKVDHHPTKAQMDFDVHKPIVQSSPKVGDFLLWHENHKYPQLPMYLLSQQKLAASHSLIQVLPLQRLEKSLDVSWHPF